MLGWLMRVPVGTIVLLSLAAVLYAAMMSCLADAPGGDAFGRGLALAYAAFIGGLLWLVLVPLSCVAVWMAGDAVGRGDSSALLIPALLPPLFALYALWARLPALHGRLRAGVVSGVVGAAIVFLTATPFISATRAALPDPARDARLAELAKMQEEQQAKERQAARERDDAEFARLGPDSALESYLLYLHTETYGARARAGIRQLTNRQADAIAMLGKGRLLDLWDLREL